MDRSLLVYMRNDGCGYDASGFFNGVGITVLKGSLVSRNSASSLSQSYIALRRYNVDESGFLKENLYFKSPSGAANFVCGRMANGFKEWKLEDGRTLDEFRTSSTSIQPNAKMIPEERHKESVFQSAVDESSHQREKLNETKHVSTILPISPSTVPEPMPIASTDIIPGKNTSEETFSSEAMKIEQTPDESVNESTRSGAEISNHEVAALSAQLATLQKVVTQLMESKPADKVKSTSSTEMDSRYHIAAIYPDAPVPICDLLGQQLHSLNVTIPFSAIGQENQEASYNLFFVDEQHQIISNHASLRIQGGNTAKCRLILRSDTSKLKCVWLAVQDQRDVQDELQMLIPFRLQLLFNTDFGF